ncbi:glycosyltransferase [Candidatus Bathyarchaeota archaeon]|nr:glycosyltransferase [Candidatus Bathyarchaeota archaeon]
MKIVMINDCAYVGETLVKNFPADVKAIRIKRSRRIWDKTFGVACKILRANADVYHIHYLLQDCYLALKFGKRPLIGHAHGSDLRSSLRHPVWGRIVRYNLKNCDKVIVSTPDVLGCARKYRIDAEYLPNPVDTELFYPKPLLKNDGKKRVLIASDSNWNVKGTDMAIKALAEIKDEVNVSIIAHGVDFYRTAALASSLDLHLTILPKVPHERLNEYYWNADVVIDRFKLGSLGMVSLEATACGRPVVAYVSSNFPEYDDFPLKDVNTINAIVGTVKGASQDLWNAEIKYLAKHHDAKKVVQRLINTYLCLLKR